MIEVLSTNNQHNIYTLQLMSIPNIAWGLILGFWQCQAGTFCSKAWTLPYSKCEQRLVALIFWWPRILAYCFCLGGWIGRISPQHNTLTTLATSEPASHMSSEHPSCHLQKGPYHIYYIRIMFLLYKWIDMIVFNTNIISIIDQEI